MLNARRHRDEDQDAVVRRAADAADVLNARRHRDEDQVRSTTVSPAARVGAQRPEASRRRSGAKRVEFLEEVDLCSTPGGIETKIRSCQFRAAGVRLLVLNARRHRDEDQPISRSVTSPSNRGAQRPEASRRRSGEQLLPCTPSQPAVLNARRHRDEDQVMGFDPMDASRLCSTPGGIETKIRQRLEGDDARKRRVLNARRHRDEDQAALPSDMWVRACAQRPEASRRRSGRKAAEALDDHLRVLNARRHRDEDQKPRRAGRGRDAAVLNARRHRDEDQGRFLAADSLGSRCSTPGGIETKIRIASICVIAVSCRVLNARRHRDEDQKRGAEEWIKWSSVLNARRHRDEDQLTDRQNRDAFYSLVLNARRHRDEDQSRRRFSRCVDSQCSTPGGIETKIRTSKFCDPSASPGAQRPEASRRRSAAAWMRALVEAGQCSTPGGIETKISIVHFHRPKLCCRVLNARRHRDEDQTDVSCETPSVT